MNQSIKIITLASLVILSACVSNGGTTSNSLKPVASNAKSTGMQAVKKDTTLAMPVFRVNFMKKFDAHARQESGRWNSSASVSSHAFVETTGFDEKVFQKITDSAYQDLYQRLKAKNIQVISIDEAVKQSSALASQSQSKDFPEVDDDESSYLAKNTMYPTGFLGSQGGRLTKPPADVFKELKAGLIAVTYTVDFVASKSETDRISGWNNESLSVEINLSPAASVSGQMQFFGFSEGGCAPIGGCYGPQSSAEMTERAISSIQFGSLKNTTSTGSKIAQGAVSVLGFLSGSSSKSSAEDYTLTVDEKKMVQAVTDALQKANQQLVNKL